MKRRGKRGRKGRIWFFIVAIFILLLAVTTVTGVETRYGDTVNEVVKPVGEIRFGIDIQGGVDVTFAPDDENIEATEEQLDAAQAVVEQRLISLGITDYEIYKDVNNSRIILRFPWSSGETSYDPEATIAELSVAAVLTFREGYEYDETTYAPAGITEENVILEGSDIASAQALYGQVNSTSGEYYVQLTLTDEGAAKFEEATTRIAASDEVDTISIWMDNTAISAPTVSEGISGGTAVITGNFTAEDATALANRINSGALPFALTAESYSTISPTLGSQSLRAMVIAGIVALLLVIVFMLVNYRLPGFVASISLIGQTAGTLALISGYFTAFNSFTLTLPGIAGIILAVGMGVDANVITSERIKEELRSGKKLDASLKSAFTRGLAPVIDGNITVLIVAAILIGAFGPTDGIFATLLYPIFFAFGVSTSGTIYAFGYTLLIGVLLNFVFGIICNRVMLFSLSKFKRLRNPVLYGGVAEGKKAPKRYVYNIVKNRKKFFGLSGLLIAAILVFSLVFGVQLDVQFSGGAIINYSYSGIIETEDLETIVHEHLDSNATVQTGTGSTGRTLTVTMPGNETLSTEQIEALSEALNEEYPTSSFEQLEVNNISASVGRSFLLKCLVAVLAAFVLILIYIAIRFRKIGGWLGGLTAIIALLHDIIMVFGIFTVLQIPLNGNFIAAVLTILGYSINDTVVIYDRIRENRGLYGKKMPFGKIVNRSINQSLPRSLKTTTTTIMALTCVLIFSMVYGLNSLITFALPLIVGMVAGTYSSLCIAGPLWVMFTRRKERKLAKAGVADDDGTGFEKDDDVVLGKEEKKNKKKKSKDEEKEDSDEDDDSEDEEAPDDDAEDSEDDDSDDPDDDDDSDDEDDVEEPDEDEDLEDEEESDEDDLEEEDEESETEAELEELDEAEDDLDEEDAEEPDEDAEDSKEEEKDEPKAEEKKPSSKAKPRKNPGKKKKK